MKIKKRTAWNKGLKYSAEIRKKISDGHKGQKPWNKGTSPSQETRDKISKKLAGRKQSPETIQKRIKKLIGRTPWNKGRPWSKEEIELRRHPAWNKGKPMHPNARKALLDSKWKGGRINHQGYIRVRCEGHPKASSHGHYVLEHILVMEKCLGRYLEKCEIVHHINGIKNDNRLENLVVLTRSEHTRHHHVLNKQMVSLNKPTL